MMNAVIRTMKVEEETLKSRSYKHAITITDFADVLTKTMKFHFGMLIMHASAIANMSLEQKKNYMNYNSKR